MKFENRGTRVSFRGLVGICKVGIIEGVNNGPAYFVKSFTCVARKRCSRIQATQLSQA